MSLDIQAEVFTVDYQGAPGKRAFLLQARGGVGSVTFGIEKQQVSLLAEKLAEVLLMIDAEDTVTGTEPARDPALSAWEEEPRGRVGAIGLAYDDATDAVMVGIDPVIPGREEEEAAEMPGETEEGARITIRRDQARAFVLHALAVVDEGRELCRLCGLPKDPKGHSCPASNGHRTRA